MSSKKEQKKKETKELAFNKDEIRKSLDRSVVRDELARREEAERKSEEEGFF